MIGTIFDGRYLLISVVGKGGSSVVFNAYDRKMGCTVAIKMLDPSLSPPSERNAIKKQFVEEARAHSAISHQLATLKMANLVKGVKVGKEVYYSLIDEHVSSILSIGKEHVLEG